MLHLVCVCGWVLVIAFSYVCVWKYTAYLHLLRPRYSQLQIGWHSISRLFLKTFNLVPGVPGFSMGPSYNLVLIVNPMGRILVRWKSFRNTLEMLCHPMGWLRLVGSLKLQVSFAKEPCKRDAILQKRPIILRSILIVATPYLQLAVPWENVHAPTSACACVCERERERECVCVCVSLWYPEKMRMLHLLCAYVCVCVCV